MVEPSTQEEVPQPPSESSLRHTWAAGVVTLALLLVVALSGFVLMAWYQPTPGEAASSLLDFEALSGLAFLRRLHDLGGQLLLMATCFHLFRVVVRRAYRPPRQWSWVLGVGLLLVIWGFATTGVLLPWDATAQQVAEVSRLRGASEAETLRRAYILHCGILPLLALGGVVWHLRAARPREES